MQASGDVLNAVPAVPTIPSVPTLTRWLDASEAAAYLKVQKRSLLRWVREGKLQAYSLSGTKRRVWRFLRSDLDTALLSHPVLVSESPTVLPIEGSIQ